MTPSRVELRYASLPLIGAIAVHYWFVVYGERGECHRWEVWQTANAGGRSFGHVHCDLKSPEDGVGGGPPRPVRLLHGGEGRPLPPPLAPPERHPPTPRHPHPAGPDHHKFLPRGR